MSDSVISRDNFPQGIAIGAYACGSGAIHRNGDKLTTAAKYYVAKFRKYYN